MSVLYPDIVTLIQFYSKLCGLNAFFFVFFLLELHDWVLDPYVFLLDATYLVRIHFCLIQIVALFFQCCCSH